MYVLPYGQMSLWGATVNKLLIFNLIIRIRIFILYMYTNSLEFSSNDLYHIFKLLFSLVIGYHTVIPFLAETLRFLKQSAGLDLSLLGHVECCSPKAWRQYFCCAEQEHGIDKNEIKVVRLDGATTGVTRSPQLPRDTSDNTLGSLAISIGSRIVPCIFRN